MSEVQGFEAFRKSINDKILKSGNHTLKRFLSLDAEAYREGHLSVQTKEMMGLAASMVLRCDDCITYHLIRCHEEGTTWDEFFEVFAVALVVGGSVVIPHLRRAMATLEELASQA